MGCLTDSMARLRKNIDGSRDSRLAQQNARVSSVSAQIVGFAAARARNGAQDARARATFVTDNANGVNRLLKDFRHTRDVMGWQRREDRTAFVADMSKKTLDLLDSFNADRKSMAERSAKERADFIANMTNSVAAFINDAAQDRAGAHAVFFGIATAKKKNDIPSIAIRLIDETLAESDEGSLAPSSEQPVLPEVAQTTSAPSLSHAEVFEKMEAAEHTEVKQTKKPKKKFSEYLGPKKGK